MHNNFSQNRAEAVQIKWVNTLTDDIQLYSEATGDPKSPAIVFVHGFAQAGLAFDHQFYDHDLTSRFYMVRYDMRGHGWSSAPDSLDAYNSDTKWGEDLQSVIQAWDLKNVSLVGWSQGGVVISEYIRVAGQENVANMIYAAPSTSIGNPGPSTLNPNYTAIFPAIISTDYETRMLGFKSFTTMITKKPLAQDSYMKALGWMLATKPICSQGMRKRVSDNTQALKNLRKPTLIIQGDDDRIQLPLATQITCELISNSKLVTIENAGHACFLDQPKVFNQLISQFISH
ncbi:Alpha/Beta hydrolase protein [Umbelopsis sp. AD052]|nr:Alpha/Beta hydrolase protein [Umbelopsis sp. AD052]